MGAEELMSYTKQGELAVWEMLGRTPQTVEEDVETIKNWMKSQPHLPEVLGKLQQSILKLPVKSRFQLMQELKISCVLTNAA